jgi:hypothetical protein
MIFHQEEQRCNEQNKSKGICRSRPSSPANSELKVANNHDLLRAHK